MHENSWFVNSLPLLKFNDNNWTATGLVIFMGNFRLCAEEMVSVLISHAVATSKENSEFTRSSFLSSTTVVSMNSKVVRLAVVKRSKMKLPYTCIHMAVISTWWHRRVGYYGILRDWHPTIFWLIPFESEGCVGALTYPESGSSWWIYICMHAKKLYNGTMVCTFKSRLQCKTWYWNGVARLHACTTITWTQECK